MVQLMWYTTKVGHDVERLARDLALHTSYPCTEHWKESGSIIGYLKGKEIKYIFIRKPKVLKAVMFCNSNYATDKDTRNSASGIVATLVGALLMCSSKTKRTVALISNKLLTCAKEVKLVYMSLEK